MTYQAAGPSQAQAEVLTFDSLRRRNRGRTQRGDFYVLAIVRAGHGSAVLDFRTHALAERTVVLIGPGVVHRWTDIAELTGDIVLFVPTAPQPSARHPLSGAATAASWTAPAPSWRLVTAAVEHLRLETEHENRAPSGTEIPSLLLSALLARLSPLPHGSGSRRVRSSSASAPSSSATSRPTTRCATTPPRSATRPELFRAPPMRPPDAAPKATSTNGSSWRPNASLRTTASPPHAAPSAWASPTPPTSRPSSYARPGNAPEPGRQPSPDRPEHHEDHAQQPPQAVTQWP